MKQARVFRVGSLLGAVCLCAILLGLLACGGDEPAPSPTPPPATATQAPEPTAAPTEPSVPVEETPAPAPAPTEEPDPTPTAVPSPTPEPDPTPEDAAGPRAIGDYDGITFVVSEGSEATFTVEEQLTRLPLPNDAVMRTSALSGEVYFDGRPSEVQVDLHQLESDQVWRDRYVRDRMFPANPIASFGVSGDQPLPDGMADGEEVTASVTGSLQVRDITVPLTFDLEVRDDGEVVYIVGRTVFTWDQLEITPPTAPVVASIEDDVRVEVLLALVPGEA